MRKNIKCINIFEKNKKKLNLYQISIIIILLITLIQIGINFIKYTQLNEYIATNSYKKNSQSQVENTTYKNSYTQQSNIKLSKIKEVSSIIGIQKIQSINVDNNKVNIKGYCKDIKILKEISNLQNIKSFNINKIERQSDNKDYFFDIEYKIGG